MQEDEVKDMADAEIAVSAEESAAVLEPTPAQVEKSENE